MGLYRKTVFMLIFILVIPFVNAVDCYDSDGGLNYSVKGCVTFFGLDYCDKCVTSKILIEGYCNEGKLFLTSHDCSPDLCENGNCIQITTTSTTTTTTTPPEERSGAVGTTTTTTPTTTATTTTQITTTSTTPTTTTSPTEGISLSCEGTPSHSCSEKKDSYLGVPDIEKMDFFIPNSANCEDIIKVTVKWIGFHGFKGKYYTDDINSPYIQYNDTNIDECTPNYWAIFLETSPGSYSLLSSCQSFNEPDCELFNPNNYTMSFDVKMPNKDSVVDGTYNIFVTGETDSGYCDPGEANADIERSKPINLMNCDESSSATTTSTTTTPGSTNTPIITTTPISDEVSPTTTTSSSSTITTTTANTPTNIQWESIYTGSGGYPIINIEEYNIKLYFASNGKNIYVFDGSTWSTIQSPIDVPTLQTFNDKLHVAGGQGKIYSYDDSDFNLVYETNSQYAKMLGVYNDKLYAATFLARPAKLYYSTDGTTWQEDTGFSSILDCPSFSCSIDSLEEYNSKLYVGSGGRVYEYDGTWDIIQNYTDVYAYQNMKVFNNKLYFATRDQSTRCPMYAGGSGFCGRVIEYDGTNWNTVFDHIGNNGYWMYSLEVYNGRLYTGTANKIYTTNDGINWQLTFNSTTGAEYVMVLKAWNGNIYAGLGNGKILRNTGYTGLNLLDFIIRFLKSIFGLH